MKPTVLKWIKCLKVILPFFKDIIDINALLDDLLKLHEELKIKPIERLYLSGNGYNVRKLQRERLMVLMNFEKRWIKFENNIIKLKNQNNKVGFGRHRSYETFFFRILNNVMNYFDKNADITDASLQFIQDKVTSYLNLRNLKTNLKINLENARNDFRNDIPALNQQIREATQKYSNMNDGHDFIAVCEIVDELIEKKEIFKSKWASLELRLNTYGDGILDDVDKKIETATKIHEQFGDNV